MAAMADRVEETRSKILTTDTTFAHSFEVDVSLVDPDPDQARKAFDEGSIAALAESFKAQGQLQPILLRHHPSKRGHWLIVAGERRWRAARQLAWPMVLAIEYSGEHEVAALVENLQRVDLNIVEEANGDPEADPDQQMEPEGRGACGGQERLRRQWADQAARASRCVSWACSEIRTAPATQPPDRALPPSSWTRYRILLSPRQPPGS